MPWRVFYSYSHADESLRNQLAKYLAPLKQKGSIIEWHDRSIEPGGDWNQKISDKLDSSDIVIALLSPDFLASEYCFGIEMEKAFSRLKREEIRLVPVLLRPCMWEESRFSAIQMIPRDSKPVTSWPSVDEALKNVAMEIREIVSQAKPESIRPLDDLDPTFMSLVRAQVQSYGRLYERTRQRLRPSDFRTNKMQEVFERMNQIATASYPLLEELKRSPSPGDRLSAVAILQTFADVASLDFLVELIGSQKPFVGYHAAKALRFAVSSIDTSSYSQLLDAIRRGRLQLETAAAGFDSDRQTVLRLAEEELLEAIAAQSQETARYD
jgi:hypothetical protein